MYFVDVKRGGNPTFSAMKVQLPDSTSNSYCHHCGAITTRQVDNVVAVLGLSLRTNCITSFPML
eukprot:1935363-Amphidinium_carterae.1